VTDVAPGETPEERALRKTEPPPMIAFFTPPGPVLWAPVVENGETVGAVWATVDVDFRPRAGVILAQWRDPSDALQDDVAVVALGITDVPADEWLDRLALTRDGQNGKIEVISGAQRADSLDDVRTIMGHR